MQGKLESKFVSPLILSPLPPLLKFGWLLRDVRVLGTNVEV